VGQETDNGGGEGGWGRKEEAAVLGSGDDPESNKEIVLSAVGNCSSSGFHIWNRLLLDMEDEEEEEEEEERPAKEFESLNLHSLQMSLTRKR